MTKIIKVCSRGFSMVKLLLMDREFECIKDEFDKALVNTTAVGEHVREIERSIWTVKEQCRYIMSTMHTAGIKRFHKWIVLYCAFHCIKIVNSCPAKLSVTQILSPRQIIIGRTLTFKVDL